ncbi:HET-domain-containing protein, partial [Thozetella sp. PMI_491]
LPDRLIDVQDGAVRLVPRESLDSSAPKDCLGYAALSHCWGSPADAQFQLTSTRSSLAQRLEGISLQELEAVPILRDAIEITRALSIPYLWVDCLCILQDDISDWEQHCARMDQVYSNAKVTLAAAASRSCREGFLQKKGQITLLPFRSRIESTTLGYIRAQFKFIFTGKVGTAVDNYVDFAQTPLSQRGWAVQERVLSARQIVFGPCNVHFMCPEFRHSRDAKLVPVCYTPAISDVTKLPIEEVHGLWTAVLREFRGITGASFTNPTDLLPAMAGLAAIFSRRLGDQYCAGHWKQDLPIDLMW